MKIASKGGRPVNSKATKRQSRDWKLPQKMAIKIHITWAKTLAVFVMLRMFFGGVWSPGFLSKSVCGMKMVRAQTTVARFVEQITCCKRGVIHRFDWNTKLKINTWLLAFFVGWWWFLLYLLGCLYHLSLFSWIILDQKGRQKMAFEFFHHSESLRTSYRWMPRLEFGGLKEDTPATPKWEFHPIFYPSKMKGTNDLKYFTWDHTFPSHSLQKSNGRMGETIKLNWFSGVLPSKTSDPFFPRLHWDLIVGHL